MLSRTIKQAHGIVKLTPQGEAEYKRMAEEYEARYGITATTASREDGG